MQKNFASDKKTLVLSDAKTHMSTLSWGVFEFWLQKSKTPLKP
jgi:hypothetical protein